MEAMRTESGYIAGMFALLLAPHSSSRIFFFLLLLLTLSFFEYSGSISCSFFTTSKYFNTFIYIFSTSTKWFKSPPSLLSWLFRWFFCHSPPLQFQLCREGKLQSRGSVSVSASTDWALPHSSLIYSISTLSESIALPTLVP